jgi:hypothetical protein
LKDQNVNGVVTFLDEYVIATAKAAEILGLPTEPLEAVVRAPAEMKHEDAR